MGMAAFCCELTFVTQTPAIYRHWLQTLQNAGDIVKAEAARLGVDVQAEKITDYAEIVGCGAASTPGIVIDGKLVHAGGLPKTENLAKWLKT